MEATLRLEGFSESLRGRRSFCVSTSSASSQNFLKGRLALLNTEVAHRGRKILVYQNVAAPPKWLLNLGWDTFFHIKDVQDMKLAITSIQHTARPTRVVWGGAEPPASVVSLVARMEGVTLLGFADRAPIHPEWQAIFWPSDVEMETVESVIQGRMGVTGLTGLRSVLKELRGSQVGLVWSSIEESEKKGALYWYDPMEGIEQGSSLDLVEAAAVLTEVAAFIRR
jgi:hypothetical protein